MASCASARDADPTPASVIDLVIEAHDVDSLGHANNAAYVRLLERGRVDFYRRLGLALEAPEPPRLGTVVVNLNVNFRDECVAGDRLRLETAALRRGRRSFTLAQAMTRPDGSAVADAQVTSVILDLDRRQVVSLPAPLEDAFARIAGDE